MNKFKKLFPDVYRYHKKVLAKYRKNKAGLDFDVFNYLGAYLRYLRDYYTLMAPIVKNLNNDAELALLSVAVSEYDAYNTCIAEYYIPTQAGLLELRDKTKSRQDTLKEYQEERQTHWQTFWELARQCLEGWNSLK